MKTLKAILLIFWILAGSVAIAETAAADKQEPEWPKKLNKEEVEISIYQPQINSLEGDLLDARAALSVKKKGEKLIFGAMWFTSKLDTDFDTRLVSLNDVSVESVKFPDASEEDENALIGLLESSIPGMDMTFSLDRLLTSLEMTERSAQQSEKLNHAPPKVHIEDEAAVLVLIDGEPILEDIENTQIQYVVNTPYFILYNKSDGFFYLRGGDWWFRAGRVENTWRSIDTPPASIQEIQSADENYQTDVDSIARTLEYPPKIVLSKEPAELIITDGEPDFAALEGTDLLYVRNTESEVLMDINSQEYYALLAGRWYKSGTFDEYDWVFVNPDELPEYFANIDTESEMGSVRSSVPNTREAKEAILENQIPQTAEIDRKTASIEVSYDGNPQFERIQGTEMSYATNTDKSVLLVDSRYYAVDNAVWFVSDRANGPWEVCVSVPDDIQSIPPEYPVYNVKYVHVYDYTPEVVYVGYTPGYVYSYPYHGTIVYGTGYHYRPWYRSYYYPRPVTYGYGVHYNPYTGWGFSVGVSYGWVGYSYHRSPYYYTSWWGPAGYSYGYKHGYYHGYSRSYYRGYYHGYSYGVYTSSRSGYRTGYATGHHHAYTNNVYKSRKSGVIHTGTRPTTTYGRGTASSASRSARSSYSRPATADKKNNVYTDKNGNVYRKKGDSWQSREDGSWKKSDVPERNRSATSSSRTVEQQANPTTRTRPESTSTQRSSTTQSRTSQSGTTNRTRTESSTSRPSTATSKSSSATRSSSQTSRPAAPSTGKQLSRESKARSQGSQRSYNYQKSQQTSKSPSSTSRSSSSSSSRSSASQSRSTQTKSSGAKRR